MTVEKMVQQLCNNARIRIESEHDKEQTGMAWAFDGTVDEFLNAETESAYKGRRFCGYVVRDLRINELKICFIIQVD